MIAALLAAIICSCGIGGPTTGPYEPADREPIVATAPPPVPVLWTTESANARCVGMVNAISHWSPGWNVDRMSAIAYRESRCDPNASNSCCSGIFQIHRSWISQLGMCGVYSRSDLYDPWKNICAASIIWRAQGMGAWDT